MIDRHETSGNLTTLFITSKGTTHEVLISTEDLQRVLNHPYTWQVGDFRGTGSGFRAYSAIPNKGKGQTTLYLHRFILNPPPGKQVDHINHDTLNNSRENLRIVEPQENAQNKKGACKCNVGGTRGVTYHKRDRVWQANIRINSKLMFLGYYDTVEEADRVARAARATHFPFSKEGMLALQEAA